MFVRLVGMSDGGSFTQNFDDPSLVELWCRLDAERRALDAREFQLLQRLATERATVRRGRQDDIPLELAAEARSPKPAIAGRFNAARTLAAHLPLINEAFATGDIHADHAKAIARLAVPRHQRDAAIEDQPVFLRWARTEQWPQFITYIEAWETLHDPTDPNDLDASTEAARSLVWSELGDTALIEIVTSNLGLAQFKKALQPVRDRLFTEDWAAAEAIHGDDTTIHDLARTERQRFHDAWLILSRAGAGAIDPGVAFVLNLVMDAATFQNTLNTADLEHTRPTRSEARAAAAALLDEDARTAADSETGTTETGTAPPLFDLPQTPETYRCETLDGLLLTPTLALRAALQGHIRRIVLEPDALDFTVSQTRRFFRGPIRIAMTIRDRHCTTPGCGVPAHRCEADHITRHTNGGHTLPAQGHMLCPRCHRRKTALEALGIAAPP